MKRYRTSDLFQYFGVSRDTLRFYEEKGLLSPDKNLENNYRNYDITDIYNLMIIDFYKMRGMTIQQIQELKMKGDLQVMQDLVDYKKLELEKKIFEAQYMLRKIEETQEFSKDLNNRLYKFDSRTLPLYKVNGEISDFAAVEEYENVKDVMTMKYGDMLSQIMRYITFDENGVTGTKMLIVEEAEQEEQEGIYLKPVKCLCMVVEEIQPNVEQKDLMEVMFQLSADYARANGFRLLGEAYAMIRLITYQATGTKAYIEIFIPFEEITY